MARVGRAADPSQVALNAVAKPVAAVEVPALVRPLEAAVAQAAEERPSRRSRRTTRSTMPSPSMSIGYAPVTPVRSVAGSGSRVKRSAPPTGLSLR